MVGPFSRLAGGWRRLARPAALVLQSIRPDVLTPLASPTGRCPRSPDAVHVSEAHALEAACINLRLPHTQARRGRRRLGSWVKGGSMEPSLQCFACKCTCCCRFNGSCRPPLRLHRMCRGRMDLPPLPGCLAASPAGNGAGRQLQGSLAHTHKPEGRADASSRARSSMPSH